MTLAAFIFFACKHNRRYKRGHAIACEQVDQRREALLHFVSRCLSLVMPAFVRMRRDERENRVTVNANGVPSIRFEDQTKGTPLSNADDAKCCKNVLRRGSSSRLRQFDDASGMPCIEFRC